MRGTRPASPEEVKLTDQEPATGYYRLEVVAEMVGLPSSRIRAYEEAGLIQPARLSGRIRFYQESELARLRRLRRLAVHLGLNQAGVEVVARLLDDMEQLRAEVRDLRGRRE